MSPRFTMLAQPECQQLEQQALVRRLLAHGVVAALQPSPPTRCLRFRLGRPDGEAICRVDAGTWAVALLPELTGLDWKGMDDGTIFGLTAQPRPLRLDHPGLDYTHAEPLPPVQGDASTVLPMIQSEEGPVWIEHMDWTLPFTREPLALSADLRLLVRLQLGRLRIAGRRMRRLRCGDILLLRNPAPRAWRGDRALFDFNLHPESIIVHTISPFDDTAAIGSGQAGGNPDAMPDLADIPLNLDVSLGELHLCLGELSTLQAGTVLPLPEQAYQRVQLLHGSQLVATGELVQVGDRLGVQLTRVAVRS